MVMIATALGRSGLQDWLIQRVTALIMVVYLLYLLAWVMIQGPMTYLSWQTLMGIPFMRYSTMLAILSSSLHAWVGLWIISTDYLKSTAWRLILQLMVIGLLLGYFVWGIRILWG